MQQRNSHSVGHGGLENDDAQTRTHASAHGGSHGVRTSLPSWPVLREGLHKPKFRAPLNPPETLVGYLWSSATDAGSNDAPPRFGEEGFMPGSSNST